MGAFRNTALLLLLWFTLASAWAPSSRQSIAGRTPMEKKNGFPIAYHPRQARSIFRPTVRVRVDKGDDDDKKKKLQEKLNKFILNLGRGILFAKPLGPTVSQFLFGIESKRKNEKKTDRRKMAFTLREALTAIGIYLTIGIIFYSVVMEHWSVIDSIYYSIVLFTTVGYGDLAPHSAVAKIFTLFFSFGGIAFLAAALASIGSNIVETELKAAKAAKKVTERNVLKSLKQLVIRKQKAALEEEGSSNVTAVVPFNATITMTVDEPQPPPKQSLKDVGIKLLPLVVFLVTGGLLFGRLEGWTIVDSIYFGFITAGTVGLGDFCPTLQKTRLLAALFIPFAVATGGNILTTIASAFLQRRRSEMFDNMANKEFSMDHIKEMDTDGDGEVSRIEYMTFMLVEMQLVEKDVIDELQAQFDRLDLTKGGSLSKDDLILMAKLRRKKNEEEAKLDDAA